jgi:hypothetical protein
MKINVSIDPNYPEDLDISIKAKTADPRIKQIENLLGEDEKIVGFDEKGFAVLNPEEVYYFATEDGKIYAHLGKKKVLVKKRIYELEAILEKYPDYFLINQGSIANLKKVERMSASLNGSLSLVFLKRRGGVRLADSDELTQKEIGLIARKEKHYECKNLRQIGPETGCHRSGDRLADRPCHFLHHLLLDRQRRQGETIRR